MRGYERPEIVEDNMRARSEMKRVRTVGKSWKPKLGDGDHLSIAELDPEVGGFFTPRWFAAQKQRRQA
jgi:hypothetical protein